MCEGTHSLSRTLAGSNISKESGNVSDDGDAMSS